MSEQTDAMNEVMAAMIDRFTGGPWVLVEARRNAEDDLAFGVTLHAGGGIADKRTIAALLRKVLAELEPEVPPVTRVFTFGGGQHHPITRESLRNRYVEITAESIDHCRATMLNHFGNVWSHDYATAREAGMDRYDLRELPREEWPPSSDRFYVDEVGRISTR